MTAVRFIFGQQVGCRCYGPGEIAGVPDEDARLLVERGVAVLMPPRPAVSESTAVAERVTKPLQPMRRGGGLRRLLEGKS